MSEQTKRWWGDDEHAKAMDRIRAENDAKYYAKTKREYIGNKLAAVDAHRRYTFDTLRRGSPSFEAARSEATRIVRVLSRGPAARCMPNEPKRRPEELRQPPRGLLMFGPAGLGKTHLMKAMYHELLEQDNTVMWVSALHFIYAVQETYNPGSDRTRLDVMKNTSGPQAVFIDDLGKERHTEDVDGIWWELSNWLEERTRTVVVSTNLTLEQVEDRYDDATVDRLRGMCKFVRVRGDSQRESGIRKYADGS